MQNNLNLFNAAVEEYRAKLQMLIEEASQNKDAEVAEYTLKLRLYEAELSGYAQQINGEVSAATLQLNEYKTKAEVELQHALNVYNAEALEYRSEVEMAMELARQTKDADVAEYRMLLELYQAKIATYREEVQKDVREFRDRMEAISMQHMQKMRELEFLKREYNQALFLTIGITQPGISTGGEPVEERRQQDDN